jgi:hypothetical protein
MNDAMRIIIIQCAAKKIPSLTVVLYGPKCRAIRGKPRAIACRDFVFHWPLHDRGNVSLNMLKLESCDACLLISRDPCSLKVEKAFISIFFIHHECGDYEDLCTDSVLFVMPTQKAQSLATRPNSF